MENSKRLLLSAVLFGLISLHAIHVRAEEPGAQATSAQATEEELPKKPEELVKKPIAPATPASTPAPVVEAKKVEVNHSEEEDEDSNQSSWGVGPYVTGIALPRPISFGLESQLLDRYLGISADYGFIPQLTFSSVKVKLTGWDARVKFYPFKGSFFIGIGYGSQKLEASSSQTISGIPTTANISQDNSFILPHVGWNWVWDSGFFMGLDLGVQLSLSRTTTFTTDVTNGTVLASAEYANLRKDVTDKADLIGKTPLPLLTLLKLGFMF